MPSRSMLFLAAAFAAGVAGFSDEIFRLDCAAEVACDVKCCAGGMTLSVEDATCTSKVDGSVCKLCGGGADVCPEVTVENSGSPVAEVLDKNDEAVVPSEGSGVGGSGGGLPPTRPNAGVTLTLGTYNGMKGWMDIKPSKFINFHDFMLGLTATLPSFYTKAGFKVLYNCRRQGLATVPGFKGCNIFMFTYRCPPCAARDGDLGARLLAMDTPTWYANNCGPKFTLNDVGFEHQFAVYSAELADGAEVKIELTDKVEFMFWAMVGKSIICAARNSQDLCSEAPNNCEWSADAEECRPRTCDSTSAYQGPPVQKCITCCDDEEEFLPMVVGV